MLRVGVVGVNGIGQAHLWALRAVEGVELAAVCDVDATRAANAADAHHVPAFTDARECFEGAALDAVVIATPAGTHAELVRAALDAGLHVYCEKPITPTSDEGYALAEHAAKVDRVLQVGFQFRFHAGYRAMRDAVAGIGEIRRVNVVATNWFRAQQYFRASPWRASWRMAGGGVLMNQAVHQLDCLVATVGMPTRVDAHLRRSTHHAPVEDDVVATLEWPNAIGTLIASLSEPGGAERFEIVGARGVVELRDGYDVRVARHDDVGRIVEECPDEFPEEPLAWETVDVPRASSEWFDMFCDAHREFAAAVNEGRAPLVDAVNGTASVELANACYLSSVRGGPVTLPLGAGEYGPVFEELVSGRSITRL